MNLDKFTQKSQEAVFQAQEIARDYNHQHIEPAHLLLALLRQDQGVVPAVVTRVAGSVGALLADLQSDKPLKMQQALQKLANRPAAKMASKTRFLSFTRIL